MQPETKTLDLFERANALCTDILYTKALGIRSWEPVESDESTEEALTEKLMEFARTELAASPDKEKIEKLGDAMKQMMAVLERIHGVTYLTNNYLGYHEWVNARAALAEVGRQERVSDGVEKCWVCDGDGLADDQFNRPVSKCPACKGTGRHT